MYGVKKFLESLILENGLVTTETLQKWRRQNPRASLEALLIEHASEIREDLWNEFLAQKKGGQSLLPATGSLSLSPLGFESEFQEWQIDLGFAVLQESPFFRIVLLNPENQVAIAEKIQNWIQDQEVQWCYGSPQLFSKLFSNPSSQKKPPLPHPRMASLEQFDSLHHPSNDRWAMVYETGTYLWWVSPDPEEFWQENVRQASSKELFYFQVDEIEWERLKTTAQNPTKSIEAVCSPRVEAWGVDWSQQQVERDFLELILEKAVDRGASDIHLEPKRDHIRVRFRIHGELVVQPPIPLHRYPLLLRRAKVLSGMRPDLTPCHQDGATDRMIGGKRYDQRYSILLLKEDQECLVIRIFGSQLPTLDQLNLGERERETLNWYLGLESGMLVTSGPTGSGKTTTLYACLAALDEPQRRLVTVENPVEKFFENATQVDIRDEKSTFSQALRTVLRQDPDVIMVGEMRDYESAEMAMHASLTGHLVLTTTHALDAVGVLERMTGSFKLDRVALGYSLKLSIAQRLLSLLCPHCKEPIPWNEKARQRWKIDSQKTSSLQPCRRVGCKHCQGTGIVGRRVVMEMMPIDDAFIERWESRASLREIRQWNRDRGFRTIFEQVQELFLKGEVEAKEAQMFGDAAT